MENLDDHTNIKTTPDKRPPSNARFLKWNTVLDLMDGVICLSSSGPSNQQCGD